MTLATAHFRSLRFLSCCPFVLLIAMAVTLASTAAAQGGQYKTVGGVAVYIGFMPAELLKGPLVHPAERLMHGGVPRGSHQYHVIVAVFDAASQVRISDATVIAKVSGIGLSGSQQTLDPMKIAGTITYGGFFYLPGPDGYTIQLTIQRRGSKTPVELEFKYDHGRR
jgi:hypothetical protein